MKKVSKIGGQAVLEGVMMRGEKAMATAVRDEFSQIVVSSERITQPKEKYKVLGFPVIRGVVAFVDSLIKGVSILVKSAEVYGGDMGEPSRFEKWLSSKLKIDVMNIAIALGLLLGVGLAVFLFFILPTLITSGITALFNIGGINHIYLNLIEGVIRILIFVGYILLVSMLKDIKRTFMYHGAEHKVINCYEQGLLMNVENAKEMSTINDRCGTTFLFLVMMISILVFSVFSRTDNIVYKILTRIALLPLVAGLSYELLRLLAKTDNKFLKIFKYPGLLLQRITTKEPDEGMIEVALAAFNTVSMLEQNPDMKPSGFNINRSIKSVMSEVKELLKGVTLEDADTEWIISKVMNVNRSAVKLVKFIDTESYNKIIAYAKERATGRPLQYVLSSVSFYNIELKVDERVLIPRPETEILVENALPYCEGKKVLDICTGSGAIALAIASSSTAEVTGSDISEEALSLAKENAKENRLNIRFILSDMFDNIRDRYDIITANPPYIRDKDIEGLQREIKDYEPRIALSGGEDGLKYIENIIDNLDKFLNNGGMLFMEVGIDQAEFCGKKLVKKGYRVEIIKDLGGIDRIIKAVLNV